MRPFLWSFWNRLPPRGRITIFDKSWHRIALPDGMEKYKIAERDPAAMYRDINAFEKQLANDGTLVVKYFLHISRDEQRKRFRELEKHPDSAWRVREDDIKQNQHYDECLVAFSKMLEMADTMQIPWHIIESCDWKYAALKIFRTLVSRINDRIAAADEPAATAAPPRHGTDGVIRAALRKTAAMSEDDCKKETSSLQKQLSLLGNRLYAKRRAAVIVFEGWDAAGKGGCIKRVTEELDPRGYAVVPIGVPSPEELSRHYMWRFYQRFPKDGHIAIFDRSWYGRVLVERIEQLTPEAVWRRAYEEINENEAHWVHHGAVICKFWLHIDQDEQLRRFKARQGDPLKQYKITDDDWRNRDKWQQYERAINDMLDLTHTARAPWTIVDSNDKRMARLTVLKTVTDSLREALR